MLIIRAEQIDVFHAHEMRKFEDRVLAHVREAFPREYQEMGEGGLRDLLQEAIERASKYELESERDITLFMDLMLALGPDFDNTSTSPWVSEILSDEFYPSPSDRIDRLYEMVLSRIDDDENERVKGER